MGSAFVVSKPLDALGLTTKRRGNPRDLAKANITNDLVQALIPDWGRKGAVEQCRLCKQMDHLRDLGNEERHWED